MKIEGHWNIYTCGYCGVEFAISKITDLNDKTFCPKCGVHDDIDYRNVDVVEREETFRQMTFASMRQHVRETLITYSMLEGGDDE